jgi:hypothetical protein
VVPARWLLAASSRDCDGLRLWKVSDPKTSHRAPWPRLRANIKPGALVVVMMMMMVIGESRGLTEGEKGVYEITQKVTERSEILIISVGMRT